MDSGKLKKFFDEESKSYWTYTEIKKKLFEAEDQGLIKIRGLKKLIIELLSEEFITEYRFSFSWNPILIYGYGPKHSAFEAFSRSFPTAYFSHFSAAYIHKLTNEIPKIFYINLEQSPKLQINTTLLQENVNRAFMRKPRISNNKATVGDIEYCLLSGKHTDNLGVEEMTYNSIPIKVTSIERTLIDISVRPFYCGSIYNVIEVFKNAKDKFSSNRLRSMLKKIDYLYPYEQIIGFYLQQAGYKDKILKMFENDVTATEMYLSYGLRNLTKNSRWNLHVPESI